MPYQIREGGEDCPFEVVKEGSGERVGCHDTEAQAKKHLAALYANVPDAAQRERTTIEWRAAQLEDLNIKTDASGALIEGIITVIAVPYEQRTQVPIDGELWNEMFLYGAFNELGSQARQRFSVNRDHNKERVVGRVIKYNTADPRGLIIESRISPTDLGKETLILAQDDALAASVGFAARRADCIWDRRTMNRSIKRAYLDHLAFVPDPAYEGAQVLSVRNTDDQYNNQARRVPTPALDEFQSDPLMRWAEERANAIQVSED